MTEKNFAALLGIHSNSDEDVTIKRAIGRQYHVVLTDVVAAWFLTLNSRERGAIVADVYESTQEEYDPEFDDDDE